MFFSNRSLFIWIYFAISSYVTYDLVVGGLSHELDESIIQILVGPLVLILTILELISKYKLKKR